MSERTPWEARANDLFGALFELLDELKDRPPVLSNLAFKADKFEAGLREFEKETLGKDAAIAQLRNALLLKDLESGKLKEALSEEKANFMAADKEIEELSQKVDEYEKSNLILERALQIAERDYNSGLSGEPDEDIVDAWIVEAEKRSI